MLHCWRQITMMTVTRTVLWKTLFIETKLCTTEQKEAFLAFNIQNLWEGGAATLPDNIVRKKIV